MAKEAKEKKSAPAKEAATAKPKREKKTGPKEIQLPLSTQGNELISQSVLHVRNIGVLVTTTQLNAKKEPIGVSTTFINGLKPKSKNGQRFLVEDKGPKPKKDKAAKAKKDK